MAQGKRVTILSNLSSLEVPSSVVVNLSENPDVDAVTNAEKGEFDLLIVSSPRSSLEVARFNNAQIPVLVLFPPRKLETSSGLEMVSIQ